MRRFGRFGRRARDRADWPAPTVRVGSISPAATRGWVNIAGLRLRCGLGASGIRSRKREGDGATPRGRFVLRSVLYRPDRGVRPLTGLPIRPIRPSDGWCDASLDRNYNRPVRHPYPASAEHVWRQDALYDLVVVIGFNDVPRRRGGGSAIFMHLARPDHGPTAGCIALSRRDLRLVLARLRRGSVIVIG